MGGNRTLMLQFITLANWGADFDTNQLFTTCLHVIHRKSLARFLLQCIIVQRSAVKVRAVAVAVGYSDSRL